MVVVIRDVFPTPACSAAIIMLYEQVKGGFSLPPPRRGYRVDLEGCALLRRPGPQGEYALIRTIENRLHQGRESITSLMVDVGTVSKGLAKGVQVALATGTA